MSLVFAKSVLSSLYKMDGTLLVDGVANMFIFILVQSHLGIGHNWAQLGTIGHNWAINIKDGWDFDQEQIRWAISLTALSLFSISYNHHKKRMGL